MPERARGRVAWLVPWLIALAAAPGVAQDSLPPAAEPESLDSAAARAFGPPRPYTAIGEVVLINVFINRFNRWILGNEFSKVKPENWADNLKLGWEWDENRFTTNMFSHPYHGALYFNAGRSNGLNFWESAPLTFLGSWMWEYFGEQNRPALNDFFMTSFGGITLGEVFHRVGSSIRDNELSGSSRTVREIAALPVDPVGGFNRLVRGEWSKRGPNPPEHRPEAFVVRVGGGVRFMGDTADSQQENSAFTALADLNYGDPFLQAYRTPFDVFSARLQVSTSGGINLLRASGRLFGTDLNDASSRQRHVFAVNQRYDYSSNPAQKFGAQSVEAGLQSRWNLPEEFGLRTQFFGDGILLGAVDAPNSGVGERTYDFGPGAGLRFEFGLERRGITYVNLLLRTEYLHSVSGAEADHSVNFGSLELNLPIARGLGLALHSAYYVRHSDYADGTSDEREFPELRFLVVYTASGRPDGAK